MGWCLTPIPTGFLCKNVNDEPYIDHCFERKLTLVALGPHHEPVKYCEHDTYPIPFAQYVAVPFVDVKLILTVEMWVKAIYYREIVKG